MGIAKSSGARWSVIAMSFFVAFFCDVKTINAYLSPSSSEETGGPMALLYIFSVLGVIVLGLIYNNSKYKKIPVSALVLMTLVVLFYLVTALFIGKPYTSLPFFCVLTISAFMIPFVSSIDVRLFLKFMMLLSVPAILHLKEIFVFVSAYSETVSMGTCYSFLMPIIATVVYMFSYYSQEKLWQKLITIVLLLVNMVFAFFLITFGSRGPVFAILATILYFWLVRYDHRNQKIRVNKKRLLVFGIAAVFLVLLFIPALAALKNLLDHFGISLNFINKFLTKNDNGDITNGRSILYVMAFADIAKHPFLGNGFDQFFNNHGEIAAYPHNFLLQMVYDGGLLFLSVVLFFLVKGIRRLLHHCTYDDFILSAAMLFSSVPRAMFSGDLWQNGPLWMFFGLLLAKSFAVPNKKYPGISIKSRKNEYGQKKIKAKL